MNRIHVRPKISLVANKVLQKARLPLSRTRRTQTSDRNFFLVKSFRKVHLDQSPVDCEISVVFGKIDHALQMMGKPPRRASETLPHSFGVNHLSQGVDVADLQHVAQWPVVIRRRAIL